MEYKTFNDKLKSVAKAINADKEFTHDTINYTVSGYAVTKDNGKLSLSIRLTDKIARSSWCWIDEKKYFM